MTNLHKYSLYEACVLLSNRRAGKKDQKTRITIQIDLLGKILKTESTLRVLDGMVNSLNFLGITIGIGTEVTTEFENNERFMADHD